MSSTEMQVLITGVAALMLVIAGKLYQTIQDWFIKTILKQPTRYEQASLNNSRLLGKLVDLHFAADLITNKCREDIKVFVARTVDEFVNLQRDIARSLGKPTVANKIAVHDFKCAGESLKVELMRVYLRSVDINGYTSKSASEWGMLVSNLFDTLVSVSNAHYDDWYINPSIPVHDIISALKLRRSDFMELNSTLLNKIRQRDSEAEALLEENMKERSELFEAISNPKASV